MEFRPVIIADKLAMFTEHWSPKIIAQMNDYQLKLVKFEGEFVWHRHSHTDEVFLVLEGEMTVHFRDGEVRLKRGELFVVPKGSEHMTSAPSECHAMLIEPVDTVNTGDIRGAKTAPVDSWI